MPVSLHFIFYFYSVCISLIYWMFYVCIHARHLLVENENIQIYNLNELLDIQAK